MAEKQSEGVPTDKRGFRRRFLNDLLVLLMWVVLPLAFTSLGKGRLRTPNAAWTYNAAWLVAGYVATVVALNTAILVHELGHAVTAMGVGSRVRSIRVGTGRTLVQLPFGGAKLEIRWWPGGGRTEESLPPTRGRQFVLYSGGLVANAVVALPILGMYQHVPWIVTWFGLVNAALVITNLIPLPPRRSGIEGTDTWHLSRIIRGKEPEWSLATEAGRPDLRSWSGSASDESPALRLAWDLAAKASRMPSLSDAELWVDRASRSDPDNPHLRLTLGLIRVRQDRYAEGEALAASALHDLASGSEPNVRARALTVRGLSQYHLGRHEEALDSSIEARECDAKSPLLAELDALLGADN